MLCGMLDLPAPVSRNVYAVHAKIISEHCILQAEASLKQAREEVREHYGVSPDEVADILVSCDGMWQNRGFSSLFGVVFVIAYEMGKIVDYTVKSKFCKGCKYWETKDQTSDAYKQWKDKHECDANFTGSAGAMEPEGALEMFERSMDYKVRFKNLISDGDSKTHSLLLQEQPYGPETDHQVEKMDCVGHVQKRMGTALRNLKQQYRGQKLSDGVDKDD